MFSIIKKWQEGTEYFVTIEGTVEASVVEDAVEDALNRYGKPKFMVLIKETFNGKENLPGFTETEMLIQEIMGNSRISVCRCSNDSGIDEKREN